MSAESRCCTLPMQPRHHDHHHHHHHHHHNHGYHPHDIRALTESTSKLTSAPSAYSARSDDAASRSKRRSRKAPGRGLGLLCAGLPGLLFLHRRGRRASHLSEARLRRRVRRHAERGGWESVRRLLSGYEFSDLPPEEVVSRQQQQQQQQQQQLQQGQGFVPENTPLREELQEEARRTVASCRPSRTGGERRSFTGGERRSFTSGERRSFTGKESAAAAAAIREALLEESDRSSSSPSDRQQSSNCRCCAAVDYGENILHDVMRRRPPLDVAEALLGALRHRGGSTVGTDGRGRTPLHVAASSGADPAVIDALIRADPCPASAGDADGRSPLHLAVRLLARGGYDSPQERQHRHRRGGKGRRRVKGRGKGKDNNASAIDEEGPALGPREAEERTYRTVLLLKAAMLAHPGRIGFKDEDVDGYSPLDYAIDHRDRGRGGGGIDGSASSSSTGPDDIVKALVRRKEPVRSSPRGGSVSSLHLSLTRRPPRNVAGRRRTSLSADDQDMEVLRRLERDEIDARRQRIERIRARIEREVVMHDALFDVFGIEKKVKHHHQPPSLPTALATVTAGAQGGDDEEEEEKEVEEETSVKAPEGSLLKQERSRDSTTAEEHRQRAATTEEDIYDMHLQDYLEDCMEDFEDCEGLDLEYCDYGEDDDFDILKDPSLAREEECSRAPVKAEVPLPFFLAFSDDDDDCASVLSEITVSLAR